MEVSDDSNDRVSDGQIARLAWRKQPKLPRSRSDKRVCCKRIRRLRKMIPNTESVELNGLFRETADYVLWLQMKVRVMQALVHVLKGSD